MDLRNIVTKDGASHAIPVLIADELEQLRMAMDFLYPRWGQKKYTLHAPDALQDLWSVWDVAGRRTFAMGRTPVEAAVSAQRRLNHEQCVEYAKPV